MIIFVGDKPSERMKPGAKPFEGANCETRLKEWILYINDSNKSYVVINAHDNPPKLTSDISYQLAYLAMEIVYNKRTAEKVHWIALGNNAAEELSAMRIPHFKLPHPSGRNRQLNDKKFISQKLAECKAYICQNSK